VSLPMALERSSGANFVIFVFLLLSCIYRN
jgi:hypothetical protein